MVNYSEMEQKIANHEAYNHGSSHAGYENSNYSIYSYNTKMAEFNSYGICIFFNEKHYSSTTSRLQNIIRRNCNLTLLPVSLGGK
jgi:hypothetical protein